MIRPTTEEREKLSPAGHLGIRNRGNRSIALYFIEIEKFYPDSMSHKQATPLWVPLVENGEIEGEGVEWFLRRDLDRLLSQDRHIDTLLLACTHYPLLLPSIKKVLPPHIRAVEQGPIVADKLLQYLANHPEIDQNISKNGNRLFLTTETAELFEERASRFFGNHFLLCHLYRLDFSSFNGRTVYNSKFETLAIAR